MRHRTLVLGATPIPTLHRRSGGGLALLGAALLLAGSAGACVSHRVDVEPVSPRAAVAVKTPVKAHLEDGSTVVFAEGVSVDSSSVRGTGRRYDINLQFVEDVREVPLDNVVGMESFRTAVNGGQTFVLSTLATAGAVIGGAVLAVAIFGSCPTVYSEGPHGPALEAETFSNSITPLFEGRDVDRLAARPAPDGTLRLEVRNEALETHYLNHLQLLTVSHDPAETVIPDEQGRPLAVRDVRPPATAEDRRGRDVRGVLGAGDGKAYRSDRRTLESATTKDMDDWIDLTAPVPAGTSTVALILRERNSLLKSVLFYDVMLAGAGARSLDWLGSDLDEISTAVALGRWHTRRMGLHVWVREGEAYREVVRIPDSGPIAWHDVAVLVPVPAGEPTVHLRLTFVADHWRIDRIGIASSARRVEVQAIPIAEITGPRGAVEADGLASLRAPDEKYLETRPGQRFFARFDVGRRITGVARTFFLSSQGYYTEWVRGSWIRSGTPSASFAPSDATLLAALHRWNTIQASFERRFEKSRVPVM